MSKVKLFFFFWVKAHGHLIDKKVGLHKFMFSNKYQHIDSAVGILEIIVVVIQNSKNSKKEKTRCFGLGRQSLFVHSQEPPGAAMFWPEQEVSAPVSSRNRQLWA